MSTVRDICEAIGRRSLSRKLGVRAQAVSNAIAEGRFPAKWFVVVRLECESRGLACPEALFNFSATAAPGCDDLAPPPAEDAA